MPGVLNIWVWLAFGLGLLVGSFLNVMALRLLADQNFVTQRSHCPQCGTLIAWYDNIPVLSYLLLGARCRHCHGDISLQYPLTELATGLLFAAVVAVFGLNWGTPFLLFFVANLVVMTLTDLREKLIFHLNSMPLIPAGLLYNLLQLDGGRTSLPLWTHAWVMPHLPWTLHEPLVSAVLGVVGIFLLFEGMILASRLVFGTDGFGHGDTYLLMGVAAFLGWELALLAMVLGLVLQAVVALPLMVGQWLRNKQYRLLTLLAASLGFALLPYGVVWLLPTGSMAELAVVWACSLGSLVFILLFLKDVRERQQFSYIPLGPALVVASLALLFAAPWLRAFYRLVAA